MEAGATACADPGADTKPAETEAAAAGTFAMGSKLKESTGTAAKVGTNRK